MSDLRSLCVRSIENRRTQQLEALTMTWTILVTDLGCIRKEGKIKHAHVDCSKWLSQEVAGSRKVSSSAERLVSQISDEGHPDAIRL